MEHISLPPPEPRPSGDETEGLRRRELKEYFARFSYSELFDFCQDHEAAAVAELLASGERLFPPERTEYSEAIQYAKYQWLVIGLIDLAARATLANTPRKAEVEQLELLFNDDEGLATAG